MSKIYSIPRVNKSILDHISKISIISNDELIDEKFMLTNKFIDSKLVDDLFQAKELIADNYNLYSKYRDAIIKTKRDYDGHNSKYHTFNKLLQCLQLAKIEDRNYKTFFDVCFAPGAFIEGLFNKYDIDKAYGITLYGKNSLAVDRSIIKNPKFKQISPRNGNIYLIENFNRSEDIITEKLDLVVSDGGINMKTLKNENLQSLANYHLIFCEFIYGISFLKNNGVFICKLFDIFDDFINQLIMLSTLYFDQVYICKPEESRSVNSEKYLICVNFNNENLHEITSHLFSLMIECSSIPDASPGLIFDENYLDNQDEYMKKINDINKELVSTQVQEIKRVINQCIELSKK